MCAIIFKMPRRLTTMNNFSRAQSGYSLVEMIVAIGIASILIVGLTIFVGRAFTVSREQFEQVRITEDARLELERMSDALRNARYVDRNNNGVTSDPQEGWLLAGGTNDIIVYTNVDADADAELVRYFVNPSNAHELQRSVTQLQGTAITANEKVETLTRSLRNGDNNQSLFLYYAANGTLIPAPVSSSNLASVARVGIVLIIDANDKQKPDAAIIATDVTPRTTVCSGSNCQSAGSGCTQPAGIPLGPYLYASNSFIEDAGQTCKAHCDTVPADGQACPWYTNVAWDQSALVTAYCSCETPAYPSPLPDIVTYGNYTNYYKEKWNFCGSTGQEGNVVCNPGYELNPGSTGQCTYSCENNNNTGGGPSPSPAPSSSPTGFPPPTIADYVLNGTNQPHIQAPVTCPDHNHIITYNTQNAISCTASGAWTGPQPLTSIGTVVGGAGDRQYTLTCSGPGGETSATLQIVMQVGAACP